mmetsp:Transcript_9875/g.44993  ORF Transcript_9875/g.44993 Transcript_9875/m.44993 type:complete len:203 (-) Transcript_9875:65-673(-)
MSRSMVAWSSLPSTSSSSSFSSAASVFTASPSMCFACFRAFLYSSRRLTRSCSRNHTSSRARSALCMVSSKVLPRFVSVVTWPACMCVAAPVRYIETPREAGPRADAGGGRRKPRANARRAIVVMGGWRYRAWAGRGAVCVSRIGRRRFRGCANNAFLGECHLALSHSWTGHASHLTQNCFQFSDFANRIPSCLRGADGVEL